MAYRDPEPDKAKRVIQSMVSIFVESGLGASRKDTDSAKTFLNEQIKIFETKLEEAEARLKEFRLRNIDRQGADGKDVTTRLSGDLRASSKPPGCSCARPSVRATRPSGSWPRRAGRRRASAAAAIC